MNLENKRPEIFYPTKWEYKIIGSDVDEMIKAVEEVIIDFDYNISASNISRKGKYFSLNVSVIVPSELIRDLIFQKLAAHQAIKFVI
jgi:putative lipoic acid-binding regulatory protein